MNFQMFRSHKNKLKINRFLTDPLFALGLPETAKKTPKQTGEPGSKVPSFDFLPASDLQI